ncbi:DHH family phosphoesterase [Paradesulfitobacterium ferrireducens]|uniref:DHH family phosphoesterase n=1 Tax=Paradesulfitobacterium ferrireducens TaxID=2816476 RepID=UPI001A8CD13B|nr:bifunctional oligoribonuclease/PAP phosphatase NrnA [Paradesulfitobacterium ferrireducens]
MPVNNLAEMAAALKNSTRVALFSHVSPDGDCIGSMLALGIALRTLGKEVYYYNPDPVPHNLAFLPETERISAKLPNPWPEVLLFVDCADLGRVKLKQEDLPASATVLNLDHHISNESFGKINVIDPQASASGEIAFALISELGVELDQAMATNLYTAIVTDTGSFQYSNTTAQTHRLIANLIEKGIDFGNVHHHVFDQKPLAQVKLLQRALASLEILDEGQLAVMTLTLADFKESGAEESLTEGLVNHGRTIAGVEVAALLREIAPAEIRVGLRSNLWLNVNEMASKFGGGGHKRAAGCTLHQPLAEAKKNLIEAIREGLGRGRVG